MDGWLRLAPPGSLPIGYCELPVSNRKIVSYFPNETNASWRSERIGTGTSLNSWKCTSGLPASRSASDRNWRRRIHRVPARGRASRLALSLCPCSDTMRQCVDLSARFSSASVIAASRAWACFSWDAATRSGRLLPTTVSPPLGITSRSTLHRYGSPITGGNVPPAVAPTQSQPRNYLSGKHAFLVHERKGNYLHARALLTCDDGF